MQSDKIQQFKISKYKDKNFQNMLKQKIEF